jgi:hypothetical protein
MHSPREICGGRGDFQRRDLPSRLIPIPVDDLLPWQAVAVTVLAFSAAVTLIVFAVWWLL